MHYSNECVCVCVCCPVIPCVSECVQAWVYCDAVWSCVESGEGLGQESDPRWAINNTFFLPRSWREREKERVRWSFITLVRMRMNPECISMVTRVSFLPTLPLRLSPSIHTLLLSLILKCVFVQACVMLLPSSNSISSTMKSAERNTSGSSRGAWEC